MKPQRSPRKSGPFQPKKHKPLTSPREETLLEETTANSDNTDSVVHPPALQRFGHDEQEVEDLHAFLSEGLGSLSPFASAPCVDNEAAAAALLCMSTAPADAEKVNELFKKEEVTNSSLNRAHADADALRTFAEKQPQNIHVRYNKKQFYLVHDACRIINNSPTLGGTADDGSPSSFTPEEHDAVYGIPYGILYNKFPLYNVESDRTRQTGVPAKKKKPTFEECASFYCPAQKAGCNVELKIVRVNGGLLGYEKCNDSKHPFTHCNHHVPPNHASKKYNTVSLTVEQKTYIVQNWGVLSLDNMVLGMRRHTSCNDDQRDDNNLEQLRTAIANWMKEQTVQARYGRAKNSMQMSKLHLKQILDALKDQPPRRCPSFIQDMYPDNPWLRSDDFVELLWPNVLVVHHDVGSAEDFTVIMFQFVNAYECARQMVSSVLGPMVQLESDFFYVEDNDKEWQVGHIGCSDLKRKYWPLVFVISRSENTKYARQLLKSAMLLVEHANGYVSQNLIDGGGALQKAIDEENESNREIKVVAEGKLNSIESGSVNNDVHHIDEWVKDANRPDVVARRCLAHVVRMPGSRGGGKRGSKGSLARYLLNNGVSNKVMSKVSSDVD